MVFILPPAATVSFPPMTIVRHHSLPGLARFKGVSTKQEGEWEGTNSVPFRPSSYRHAAGAFAKTKGVGNEQISYKFYRVYGILAFGSLEIFNKKKDWLGRGGTHL